jgi:hypothetical protein
MDLKEKVRNEVISARILAKTVDEAVEEIFSLFNVSKSVVCGNCDGWGYTVDENGRRKEHCKECE